MKINSVLKPKHMVWASGAVLAVILLIVMTGSGAKASVQAPPPPIVEVATVEQRDVPVYGIPGRGARSCDRGLAREG
jgi:hypothetical protein